MNRYAPFRDPVRVHEIAHHIRARSSRRARFMEFCGGHTVSILRYGIRQLLPSTIDMVSGPGCPVCVTANADLDEAIAMAFIPRVMVATFGDLFKVPASRMSFEEARARGANVRMVYSPLDALELARGNPGHTVVFAAIGFETTAPAVAASVMQAQREHLANYRVLSLLKVTPPVLQAVLQSGETSLSGLVCPGHVSAVIGADAWKPFPEEFGLPCAVAGFEPLDVLQAIALLVEQVEQQTASVQIAYRRAVRREGNLHAQAAMNEVFLPCPARWRGMGEVPGSGLGFRDTYRQFDAREALVVDPGPTLEPAGCRCGEVLRGVISPGQCPLFRHGCTPEAPAGPCMVSSEGACAAHYRFGEH